MDYDDIKALGKELGRKAKDLLALKDDNDPFSMSKRRLEAAEWFSLHWQGLNFGSPTHTRAVHYRLVSLPEPAIMPDGRRYENTMPCSKWLDWASRDARYLGLVPYEMIIDKRNGESILNPGDPAADAGVYFDADPNADDSVGMPAPPRLWFDRPVIQQPFHLEIICEKSTMNSEVLLPLGRQYDVNIMACAGDISLTRCFEIVQRIKAVDGRACRILYVTDFDPNGQNMAIAAARKIEFLLHEEERDFDVQVRQVALTYEQCQQYRLPRTPIKESERRKAGWEQRYGEGGTELDALEALHPGELRRILEREILRYYDRDLERDIEEAAGDLDDQIEAVNEAVHEEFADQLAELEADYAALEQRRKDLFDNMKDSLLEQEPDIGDVEWPEPADADEDDDAVFDSSRDYVEQAERYKRQQGKPINTRKQTSATGGDSAIAPIA